MSRFGERGGWWVVGQFAVMAAIIGIGFLPPHWPTAVDDWLALAGAIAAFAGATVAYMSARALGGALTPFPEPSRRGVLVEDGPYRVVRHPIYAAGLLFFGGYGLFAGPLAVVGTAVLGTLWASKASFEERLLEERYDGYAAYERRVRYRLIPGVW